MDNPAKSSFALHNLTACKTLLELLHYKLWCTAIYTAKYQCLRPDCTYCRQTSGGSRGWVTAGLDLPPPHLHARTKEY